jgi:hypothetical protein
MDDTSVARDRQWQVRRHHGRHRGHAACRSGWGIATEGIMASTISGRFDTIDAARRAMARLVHEGVSSAAMTARRDTSGPRGQPEGLRGVSDAGSGGASDAVLDVRVHDEHAAAHARELLQAAGAHDVTESWSDRQASATPGTPGARGVDSAGGAFGMAIADAVTAPMRGVSPSDPKSPPKDRPPKPLAGGGRDSDADGTADGPADGPADGHADRDTGRTKPG